MDGIQEAFCKDSSKAKMFKQRLCPWPTSFPPINGSTGSKDPECHAELNLNLLPGINNVVNHDYSLAAQYELIDQINWLLVKESTRSGLPHIVALSASSAKVLPFPEFFQLPLKS